MFSTDGDIFGIILTPSYQETITSERLSGP